MDHQFTYGMARVCDLRVATRASNSRNGKPVVAAMELDGREMAPSPRFWRSFFTRFGISDSIFKYFGHHEVFERIAARVPDDAFRYCVEQNPKGRRTLLAVSSPKRPVTPPEAMIELVERYGADEVTYDQGVLTSTHAPCSGAGSTNIGPDRFEQRFMLETPLDGFGNPRIYLSMLRLVCSNGMIGYAPTFRSEIRVGKEMLHSLSRALESYDNGEGYAALRQRFESAQTSWASINEVNRLYRLLVKLQTREKLAPTVLNDLHRVTGNLNELYGLANLDAMSVKRQRVLPARCKVYDLLNFTSELATHHAPPAAARTLQAHLGSLISDEYDMEGTAEKVRDFTDFFVQPNDAGPPVSLN